MIPRWFTGFISFAVFAAVGFLVGKRLPAPKTVMAWLVWLVALVLASRINWGVLISVHSFRITISEALQAFFFGILAIFVVRKMGDPKNRRLEHTHKRIGKTKSAVRKHWNRITHEISRIRSYISSVIRGYVRKVCDLTLHTSIWVDEEDLGKEKVIRHQNKNYSVKIPQEINRVMTLHLKGLGRTKFKKTGDLMLHLWLNRGENVCKNLWLSETSARNGAEKKLFTGQGTIAMVIPPNSHNGLVIRIKGKGKVANYSLHGPAISFRQLKKGDLLVRLSVYPENITPIYGSFETLSTENMALEGWVYRKYDEIVHKLGRSHLPHHQIQADAIADIFNEGGWTKIFDTLVRHLQLTNLVIEHTTLASSVFPGTCEIWTTNDKHGQITYKYKITINEPFLDNPFSIAAILAHELCHVLYNEKIYDGKKSASFASKSEKLTLEDERTVDLLIFMFKMGEFQLRVARDSRLTMGYFRQEIFERIQVIVSRKLNTS